MAKTATRKVRIFINGQEVEGTIASVRKRFRQLNNEIQKLEPGTDEYIKKAKEMRSLDGILKKHRGEIRNIDKAWNKVGLGFNKVVGLIAAKFTADAVVSYGTALFKMGVELETMGKKAKVVFGENLPLVTREAEENARAIGLTVDQYVAAATGIGDLLVPLGFQRDVAAEVSTELVNLAGKTAEWTGGQVSAKEASDIYRKALLGEREALQSLGIKIDEELIKLRLKERGLDKLTGASLRQAKAMVTLEEITRQTTDAQTAFAENADGLSRKQAQLRADITAISEKLAKLLIPVFEKLIRVAGEVVSFFSDVSESIFSLVDSTGAASNALEDQEKVVRNLEKELVPLLERYDDLSVSAGDNEGKQKELKKVISDIAGIVPTAVTEFDEYGKALDINTEKARNFIEGQKFILEVTNKDFLKVHRRNLKETEINIRRLQAALDRKDEDGDFVKLQSYNGANFQSVAKEVKLTNKEVIDLQASLASAQKTAAKLKGAIAIKSGDTANLPEANVPVDKEDEFARLKIENEKQLAKDKAERAQKQAEKDEKRGIKNAEREAERQEKKEQAEIQALIDRQEKIKEAIATYDQEAFERTLTSDDLELEQIRQKYAKEFTEIEALEKKKVAGIAELKIKLQEQLDQELADKEKELEEKRKEDEDELAEQEQEALDKLNAILDTEREAAIREVTEKYDELFALAEAAGIDVHELKAKELTELAALENEFREDDLKIEKAYRDAKVNIALGYINVLKVIGDEIQGLAGDNEKLAKAALALSKAVAIAEIVVNLQRELSKIKSETTGPLSIGLQIKAGIAAAASIATVAKQKIQQRKKGSWTYAVGEDDNVTYRAQYIGYQSTGKLPNHPVVVSTSTSGQILASENGTEYFIANHDLAKPAVMNHVRAIDNITKGRSTTYPQFKDGGFSQSVSSGQADDIPAAVIPENRELLQAINNMNSLLSQLLQNGVQAKFSYDAVDSIKTASRELDQISGGAL